MKDDANGTMARRAFLRGGSSAALLALSANRRLAAQPVSGPLQLLCTAPPGSIPDIVARRFSEPLAGRYAQNVVVDNRIGAAGRIAVGALRQAPGDGTTALLAQGAIATIYPYLYEKLGYDPATDLQPVSLASSMSLGLAVGPAVPENIQSVDAFLDWMRRNPTRANAGSPGVGTLPHLLQALLFREAGLAWEHIAYPGGPPALTNLIGGQIACLALPEGLLGQHRRAGRLRVLATSGPVRTAYFPDVPTFVEAGHKDLVIREWFAFFLPGSAQPAVADRFSQAIQFAASDPKLVAAFGELAMTAVSSTPAALREQIDLEQRCWQPLLRATGIRAA